MRSSEWSSDVCSSHLLGRHDGRVRRPLDFAQHLPHLHRRLLRLIGKRLDLVGDDREALAMLAGPRCLDGGIEGKQIGLFGDIADRGDDLPDRLRLFRSEEHTSELQSLMRISYAVFCLKKKNHTYVEQHCTIREP